MTIDSLLEEWNHLFPPRDIPAYKFRPNPSNTTTIASLPQRLPESILARSGTRMLSRGVGRGNEEMERRNRAKRVLKIYTTFCDYLIFQMVRKRLLTQGFPMDKLQESNRGKVSRVSVGVDISTECVWWNHGLNRSFLKFRDILRIDYGVRSPCYTKLKLNFHQGTIQHDMIAPWNCFSLVTASRTYDFYALSNGSSGEGEEDALVPATIALPEETVMANSMDVENFLFGFSYVLRIEFRNKFLVSGLFESKKHLALIRGKIKIGYMMRRSNLVQDVRSISPKTPSKQLVDNLNSFTPAPLGSDFEDTNQEIAEEFYIDVN